MITQHWCTAKPICHRPSRPDCNSTMPICCWYAKIMATTILTVQRHGNIAITRWLYRCLSPICLLHNTATAITAPPGQPIDHKPKTTSAGKLPKVTNSGVLTADAVSSPIGIWCCRPMTMGCSFYSSSWRRMCMLTNVSIQPPNCIWSISMPADKDIEPAQLQHFPDGDADWQCSYSGVISHPRASSQERLTDCYTLF